jgi:hypothetical protein
VALAAACISAPQPPPAPDTDAAQSSSRAISYTSPHLDTLHCRSREGPDCADWFNFQPSAPGILHLRVSSAPARTGGTPKAGVPFELSVVDPSGAVIGRSVAGAEPALVSIEVREPAVFHASVTLPSGTDTESYVLAFESQLRSAPAPPAPPVAPPAGKTQRWTVLEVEAKPGAQATNVLIDGGRRDALRTGLRGRLLDGQRTLGRIVVVEVFEEGARARVEGPLSGDITPETVAEIEVPAGGE